MGYTKQTWANGALGLTPLAADRLNHLEDGVAAALVQDDLAGYVSDSALADAIAAQNANFHGVPAGGTAGQSLVKNSIADYDFGWSTISTSGYNPPVGGIPSTDMTTAVQTSLGKADSALQSVPSGYTTDTELANAIAAITLSSLGGAPLNSPNFTGSPTAPTAATGTNTTQLATTAHVKASVDAVVAGAPVGLNTLKGLSDQLASDESTASALAVTVASKVPQTRTINGKALSADISIAKADVGLGNVDNTSDVSKTFIRTQISDSTLLGRTIMGIADGASARTAIGAGTSNVTIGTSAGTAADAATVTSNLASKEPLVSPGSSNQYYRGDKTWATLNSASITDSGTMGRAVLQSADAPTVRTAIGAGTYSKPAGGIPSTDLTPTIVTSLSSADNSVQQSQHLKYVRVYTSGAWELRGNIPDGSRVEWGGPVSVGPPPVDSTYALAGTDSYIGYAG